MKIIAGLPAYNEENNIAPIITKLKDLVDTVIVCNDGSSDLTGQIAKKLGVIVIDHSSNLGYGAAIKSIFKKFLETDGDILVTIDADGQHRIEDIQKVLKPIVDNNADLVIGSRFIDDDKTKIPRYRKMGISAITKMTNVSTKQKITDSQSGFRAYKRDVISQISLTETGMAISTEILIKADKKNFRITEVGIVIEYPTNSSTHNPISHGTSVLFSTMKFTSIEHPLQFYGIPGIVLSGIGLFFIVWVIQYFADFGTFPPVLALIAIGTTVLGAVFLVTAIILYSLVNVVREGSRK